MPPIAKQRPSAGSTLKAYFFACVVFSMFYGVVSPLMGKTNYQFDSLMPILALAAIGIALVPFAFIFALPGFMLARLVLELIEARSVGAYMLAGAAASFFYLVVGVMLDLTERSSDTISEISLLGLVLVALPGAAGGLTYFLVRFGPLGPPAPYAEEDG